MGRLGSVGLAVLGLFLMAIGLSACGGGATKALPDEVPASVTLSPATNSSMDVGATQNFTATARNRNNSPIPETFSYQSSNPAVVTVAATGAICAGTWDSLTLPTICTPGTIGTAEITAIARGVISPPTTVYVHQHINSIKISVVPSQTNPPAGPCYSKDQVLEFQASAYSGSGTNPADITATVGQFAWQVGNISVVTLKALTKNSADQPVLNQIQTTANVPGTTPLFASVSGVNSAPLNFVTCAVKTIKLAVPGDTSTSYVVPTGSIKSIDATVIDTLGNTITGVPLTWSSSNRNAVSVTGATSTLFGSVGGVSASKIGAAAVIASCTPPTCNIGFSPTLPIYPTGAISFVVTGTVTTASYSLLVTSTGSGVDHGTGQPWNCATIPGCVSRVIAITGSSSGTNTSSIAGSLPSTPDSLVYEPGGTTAYLGVDSGQLGSRGIMAFTASSSTLIQRTTAPGKVLAISPDGKTVIVSDTHDIPNQVYIFNASTSNVVATLNITGATAAAFSPDNFKAYIVAGNQLYVYSALDSLKSIQLSPGSPSFLATDVAFLPVGAFAFVSGGPPDTVTAYTTCTNTVAVDASSTPQIVHTPGIPSMLRPLPNGTQVLAIDPPGVDYIDVTTAPDGCPPTLSASFAQSVNFGAGVPIQFIVSPDGLTAYILTQDSGIVQVLDIANKTVSAIALSGNATALQAALTSDGRFLYVGAEDVPPPLTPDDPAALGSVHVLDTIAGADVQQITFPDTPHPFCIGPGTPTLPPPSPVTYCYPDLIVAKP